MATTTTSPQLITFQLNNVKEAVDTITTILRRAGYKNIVRKEFNNNMHWTLTGINPNTAKEKKFYIKWQRRLLDKAGQGLVPELAGTKGAFTINVEYAQEARKVKDTTILFPQKIDGMIYEVDAEFFWEHSADFPHIFDDEIVRAIAIEDVKPWALAQEQVQRVRSIESQQQQPLKKGGREETILILKCLDCGYAHVQSKQDIYAIELKMLRDCHSRTFKHKMKGLRVLRSDDFAQKLRNNLVPWERW